MIEENSLSVIESFNELVESLTEDIVTAPISKFV